MLARIVFNIYGNAAVSFFFTSLFVHGLLKVLPIRSYQVRYFFRLSPFLKLLFDLICINLGSWLYFHGQSPLLQPENSRTLNIFLGLQPLPTFGIQLLALKNLFFTPFDIFVDFFGEKLFYPLFSFLILGSLLSFLVFLFRLGKSLFFLFKCERNVITLDCTENLKLLTELKRHNVKLCISESIPMPFATIIPNKCIILPENLIKLLSASEIDSIISHELAHIKWKDPLFSLLIECLSSVFWFLPLKRFWIKRIYLESECAADHYGKKFDIRQFDMAIALKKSYLFIKGQEKSLFASSLFSNKKTLRKRIETLIRKNKRQSKIWLILSFLFLFLLLNGRYFTF